MKVKPRKSKVSGFPSPRRFRLVAAWRPAEDSVVGVAYDDHIALGFAPSPTLGPEVEGVVQVDVGEERRNRRSLPCSLCDLNLSVLENARLQPFPDQAEDALVADAMFEKPDEPFLAYRIERRHHRLPIPKTFQLQW